MPSKPTILLALLLALAFHFYSPLPLAELGEWGKVRGVLAGMSGQAGESQWAPEVVVMVASCVFLHLNYMTYMCTFWTVTFLCLYASFQAYGHPLPYAQGLVAATVVGHWPALNKSSRMGFMFGACLYAFASYFPTVLSCSEAMVVLSVSSAILAIHLALMQLFTFIQTTPLAYVFPIVSHVLPPYFYSKETFLAADGAPEDIRRQRLEAFDALFEKWNKKWDKSMAMSSFLRGSFSDLRFTAGNRVFLPFQKILNEWCDPCTVVDRCEGVDLIDVDGHRLTDISGSYGVNVVGYDKYKEFYQKGLASTADSSVVLGPVHPILKENIAMLQEVSKKQEISFHMSGTEAVMAAVRLARFNTKKKLIVLFGGAYHGWWDGVQSAAGNERFAHDVLTLKDLAPASLEVIAMRAGEIAAVLVNPLQSFHPNAPPPSDLTLASNVRDAKETVDYSTWLKQLKAVCEAGKVVLILDEVYTGFRLSAGGAQEYFGVEGHMVCYGKTLGGGMPNGVVCGPPELMCRSDGTRPSRVAYVIGTFAGMPLTLGCMHHFLKWATSEEGKSEYQRLADDVNDFVIESNDIFEAEGIPMKLASYASVWTMIFQCPGRYHWMLQYYCKDEGLNLSWVGTGRLNFSMDFKKAELKMVQQKLLRACRRMKADQWWWKNPNQTEAAFASSIKMRLVGEILRAVLKKCTGY